MAHCCGGGQAKPVKKVEQPRLEIFGASRKFKLGPPSTSLRGSIGEIESPAQNLGDGIR